MSGLSTGFNPIELQQSPITAPVTKAFTASTQTSDPFKPVASRAFQIILDYTSGTYVLEQQRPASSGDTTWRGITVFGSPKFNAIASAMNESWSSDQNGTSFRLRCSADGTATVYFEQ